MLALALTASGAAVFASVRMLNAVVLLPPIVCAALPLKLTVPVEAVKPPLLVQLPETFIVVAAVCCKVAPESICTSLRVLLLMKVPA